MIFMQFGLAIQQPSGKPFCDDINDFGILTCPDIDELSTSVNFLDLTLSIESGKIVTKTYQKAMNLYLYLPASSAHPQGCIKGTIYGLVSRYYAQNTYRADYVYFVALLYKRLLERGWDSGYIRQLMLEATKKIEESRRKYYASPAHR